MLEILLEHTNSALNNYGPHFWPGLNLSGAFRISDWIDWQGWKAG
jgi:hypothetical protein